MSAAASIVVGIVAAIHAYIMVFEMFFWEQRGPVVFDTFEKSFFAPTKDMAANQGAYNGFLAAGLIWSLFIGDSDWQQNVAVCFLLFVAIAGVVGALTVSKRIIFVQTIPALLGLALVLFT